VGATVATWLEITQTSASTPVAQVDDHGPDSETHAAGSSRSVEEDVEQEKEEEKQHTSTSHASNVNLRQEGETGTPMQEAPSDSVDIPAKVEHVAHEESKTQQPPFKIMIKRSSLPAHFQLNHQRQGGGGASHLQDYHCDSVPAAPTEPDDEVVDVTEAYFKVQQQQFVDDNSSPDLRRQRRQGMMQAASTCAAMSTKKRQTEGAAHRLPDVPAGQDAAALHSSSKLQITF